MDNFIELYNKNGIRLIITSLEAGPVGPSWDRGNKNRKKLLGELGINAGDIYSVSQKHSREIVLTGDWGSEPLTEADGIISSNDSEKIAVTVADCMPIFLFDSVKGVRALLHSGWKGTGIVLDAIKIMESRYGCSDADITAVLGPAIGSCCYNVDDERAGIFKQAWGDAAVVYRNRTSYLSLRNANEGLLKSVGIGEIISIDRCTCCGGLGSFRREGPQNFTQMFCLSYLNHDR